MKNIIIILSLIISNTITAQRILMKNKLVADNFIVYDPPIKVKGASFIDEPLKPLWFKAYCANANPLEFKTSEEAISYFKNKHTVQEYDNYRANFPNRDQKLKDLTEYICGGYRLRFLEKNIELFILLFKKENDIIDESKPFLKNIEEGSTKFEIFKIVNNNFVVIDSFGFEALLNSINFKEDFDFNFEGEFQTVLKEQGFTIATKENRNNTLSNPTAKSKQTKTKSIPSWLEINK